MKKKWNPTRVIIQSINIDAEEYIYLVAEIAEIIYSSICQHQNIQTVSTAPNSTTRNRVRKKGTDV